MPLFIHNFENHQKSMKMYPRNQIIYVLLKQTHLVWLVSIVNIGIGFFISGFNPLAQSISEVALEAPAFTYTHRLADIVIGASMCGFGIALNMLSRKWLTFSMISICLLGLSMASAGIWTLENPLHLLYNLSIFMTIAPVVCALEFKEKINSPRFETLCLSVSFIHVFMFWCIYAGFIPSEYNGLIQRVWAVTMGWFGVAAYAFIQSASANEQVQTDSAEAAPLI